MTPGEQVEVLGVRIDVLTPSSAVERVASLVTRGEPGYVCVTGVHGVMESQASAELLAIHNASALTTPDGMPMVWSGRWAGAHDMARVYGPDLMLAVLARATDEGWTSFFYGGREGVPELLVERMTERFPGLAVVGTYSPPFRALTAEEDEGLVARLRSLQPDLIWVGLSTPKQERWMAEHVHSLDKGLMFGVGAAFDINAGLLRQAPPWMQRLGLEWLFRLIIEPRRLWKRYLSNNPRFVCKIARRKPRLVQRDSA